MTDVYVIRHAWAEDRNRFHGSTDWERPLTREGRRRFAVMVERLVERGFGPEIIATSPLVRCRQTAEIIAESTGGGAPIVNVDTLQSGSDLETMLAWTENDAGACEQVAWVGHAPDVSWLAGGLIGAAAGDLRFAKGAVAAIRFAGRPAAGQGELRWFVTAKVLGC